MVRGIALSNLPRKFNIAVAGGRDNPSMLKSTIGFIPAYKNALPLGLISSADTLLPISMWQRFPNA